MTFDINTVLPEMVTAVKGVVGEQWNEVKPVAVKFLKNRRERLELLVELRINGQLSPEKFKDRLNDEKLIIEAELNALAVISKAIAQEAVNAAANVLEKAVKTAIGTII